MVDQGHVEPGRAGGACLVGETVIGTKRLEGRRCVAGLADAVDRCRVRGQITWASWVNATATRSAGGASTASS
jgi:hypothetical protein